MKTSDLSAPAGIVTGFSVSNSFLRRGAVPKIIASISGAKLLRQQKPFRLSGPDAFCEFVVDGKTFLVIEPFGDNDRFWVVSEPPEACPQLARVRDAFEKHRVLFGLYAG